jgi:putative colanic acid biosynthesis acetyltransferase WcaF
VLWCALGRPLLRWSPHPAYGFRNAVLRAFGARVHDSARVRRSAFIDRPWRIELAERSIVGDAAELVGRGSIRIGARCTISQLVQIVTERLAPLPDGTLELIVADVVVERDAWVAADVLVLPGSIVEAESLVGARSMVDGPIPAGMICSGEPAAPRRERGLRITEERAS